MNTRLLACLVACLLLSACAPGTSPLGPASTPTATPFLPNFGGSSPTDPNSTPAAPTADLRERIPISFESYPPPTAESDISLPQPVGRFVQPEGQTNILLLGSDQRPNDGGFRTDVILLVTLNPEGEVVNLASFPRDLYVYVPGWKMDRINAAFVRGGFEMMANTMEYNFGVRPDHYVLVTFWGFESIIDTLGGITVQSARGLSDHRDGHGTYSVSAGTVYMDGETALWYVRSRATSSDFDRTRREQEVLQAIFYRMISIDAIARAPQLYEQYRQAVTTDLGLDDILPLLPLAAKLGANGGQTGHYAVGPEDVSSFRTATGAAVLLPDQAKVLQLMRQTLNVDAALSDN